MTLSAPKEADAVTPEEWLNGRMPELGTLQISFGDVAPVSLPYAIRLMAAAAIHTTGHSCVFVTPHCETVSCLAAIYAALRDAKVNFEARLNNFARSGLTVGQNIELLPKGEIYQFKGLQPGYEDKFFRIGHLGKNAGHGTQTVKIEHLLRLQPTEKQRPYGRGDFSGHMAPSDLDKMLGILSLGNQSVFENSIILHTSKSEIESLLKDWNVYSSLNNTGIKDLLDLPWGSLAPDGKLLSNDRFQAYGAPLLALSNRLSPVAAHCRNISPHQKVIISHNKEAMINNASDVSAILETQKILLFTSHLKRDEAAALANLGFKIWHFTPEETFLGIGARADMDAIQSFPPLKNFFYAVQPTENVVREISVSSELIGNISANILALSREIEDGDIKNLILVPIRRVFWRCLELTAVPKDDKQQKWFLDQLVSVNSIIDRRAAFLKKETKDKLATTINLIVDDLLPNLAQHSAAKISAIENFLQQHPSRVLLLTRNTEARAALQSRLVDLGRTVTVINYDEIGAIDASYDYAIAAGWPGPDLFSKLAYSRVAQKIVAVLYDIETGPLKSFLRDIETSKRSYIISEREKQEIIGTSAQTAFSGLALADFLKDPDIQETKSASNVASQETPSTLDAALTRASYNIDLFSVPWTERPRMIGGADASDKVEARYVALSNDNGIYMSPDFRVSTVNLQRKDFKRKGAEEMEPGDLVVFRPGGEKDMLRTIARRIYPNAYDLHSATAVEWKEWLRQLGDDAGEIWKVLAGRGLNRNIMTIANWVSNPDLIGPFHAGDLKIIAEATGNRSYVARLIEVVNSIRFVRGAHVEAGFQLSQLLLAKLANSQHGQLSNTEAGNSDLADVQLYFVEEVDEVPVKISRSFINEPHPVWWFNSISDIISVLDKG